MMQSETNNISVSHAAVAYLEWLCNPVETGPPPRVAVVVAHPDDETIGAGSRLPRLRRAALIYTTDAAPGDMRDAVEHGCATRQDYAAARKLELEQALSLAGVAAEQIDSMGYADQEASLNLPELSMRLAGLLDELKPELVITHPYEGGHPDHDATAFTVHAACRLLELRRGQGPALTEMTSYHNSAGGLEPYTFLAADDCEAVTVGLSDVEREFKRRLFECFQTQRQTLQYFPIEFERFRPAPQYDFTCPPHQGKLFYEMYPWGMTGDRFRQLARQAMAQLGLRGCL